MNLIERIESQLQRLHLFLGSYLNLIERIESYYPQALGGVLFQKDIPRLDPAFAGFYHQTIAIPIPEYLASKLPSDTIYGPGHTVSIVSSDSANMQNKPPSIDAILPNTYGSNGITMKRY